MISFHKPYKALQVGRNQLSHKTTTIWTEAEEFVFRWSLWICCNPSPREMRPIWIDLGNFPQKWCTKLSGMNFLGQTNPYTINVGVRRSFDPHDAPPRRLDIHLDVLLPPKLDEAGTRSNTNVGPIRSQNWLGTWMFNSVGRSIVIPTTLTCCNRYFFSCGWAKLLRKGCIEQPPRPKYLRTTLAIHNKKFDIENYTFAQLVGILEKQYCPMQQKHFLL